MWCHLLLAESDNQTAGDAVALRCWNQIVYPKTQWVGRLAESKHSPFLKTPSSAWWRVGEGVWPMRWPLGEPVSRRGGKGEGNVKQGQWHGNISVMFYWTNTPPAATVWPNSDPPIRVRSLERVTCHIWGKNRRVASVLPYFHNKSATIYKNEKTKKDFET